MKIKLPPEIPNGDTNGKGEPELFTARRTAHWDHLARNSEKWKGLSGYYHARLRHIYRFLIPPGRMVLEIGCGRGDLLAAVRPIAGVGVDFAPEAIRRAGERHANLQFVLADAHHLQGIDGTFDIVILSDLVNDLYDVQTVLQQVYRLTHPRSRIILNTQSRVWELPLRIASLFKLARPRLHQNWLTIEDLANLLHLAGFDMLRHWEEILLPVQLPLVTSFFNKFVVRFPFFRLFALTNMVIARPVPRPGGSNELPSVSIIIPARNEAGNIQELFKRIPVLTPSMELLFVEGGSNDGTAEKIRTEMSAHPERKSRLLIQEGKGKGDAVRLGFSRAAGDILMILDADMTVRPEDLTRFYQAVISSKGDFINGVRLVYPMEDEAMRFVNFLGNKFFSHAFSWLLGQPVKDTLCGTKVLWRSDYALIAENRSYFGDFDPFGDFDLLFGAAKLGLHIIDIPVRYGARTYGATNISRFRHGLLLIKMLTFAARRLKFV